MERRVVGTWIEYGRGKAGQVANDTPTQGNYERITVKPALDQDPAEILQPFERFTVLTLRSDVYSSRRVHDPDHGIDPVRIDRVDLFVGHQHAFRPVVSFR
jgi:hypothetical protein